MTCPLLSLGLWWKGRPTQLTGYCKPSSSSYLLKGQIPKLVRGGLENDYVRIETAQFAPTMGRGWQAAATQGIFRISRFDRFTMFLQAAPTQQTSGPRHFFCSDLCICAQTGECYLRGQCCAEPPLRRGSRGRARGLASYIRFQWGGASSTAYITCITAQRRALAAILSIQQVVNCRQDFHVHPASHTQLC